MCVYMYMYVYVYMYVYMYVYVYVYMYMYMYMYCTCPCTCTSQTGQRTPKPCFLCFSLRRNARFGHPKLQCIFGRHSSERRAFRRGETLGFKQNL